MKTKSVIFIGIVIGIFWLVLVRDSHKRPQPRRSNEVVRDKTGISATPIFHELLPAVSNPLSGEASSAQLPPRTRTYQGIFSGPLLNPLKAVEIAQSLKPGGEQDRMMDQIAQAWAIRDPDAAMEWARQRSNADERERLQEIIIAEREKQDAPDAPESQIIDQLSDAVAHIDADSSKEVHVENLTQKWAAKNLSAAFEWAEQQPEGEIRDNLIKRIALVQSLSAPVEAARLVAEQITPGPGQAEAAIMVVHQWGLRDFAGATAWVASFPEGALKERARQELNGPLVYLHQAVR